MYRADSISLFTYMMFASILVYVLLGLLSSLQIYDIKYIFTKTRR
jgi:hypothetical protein